MEKKFSIKAITIILVIVKASTKNKFEYIKRYVDEIENKFENDIQTISKDYEDKFKDSDLSPKELAYLQEEYSEDAFDIIGTFIEHFRYSIITSLYSTLEVSLNSLCALLYNQKHTNIELSDLKGAGIERAKTYFTKVFTFHSIFECKEWNEILKLNKIRNCIVHAGGELYGIHGKKKLKDIILNTKHIELIGDNSIHVEKEYLIEMIKTSEKFLLSLYEEVNNYLL